MVDRSHTAHHIEDIEEQAALFALGALPAEDARRFEQRLAAGCPLCRAELSACQQVVAALALGVPEASPPSRARRRLLDALDGKKPASESRSPSRTSQSRTKMGEGTLVRKDDDGSDWQASSIPGVQLRNLYQQKTLLVRMAPKTHYPAHDHHAAEQCLVLEGSITSDGVTAYAGDFTYMPAGSSHRPLYSENGCLLLIAYT